MTAHHTCIYGGQNKVQDPLELELLTVVSYHVVLDLKPGTLEEFILTIEPSFYSWNFYGKDMPTIFTVLKLSW